MSFKCKIGLHSWNGCKCFECGKIRDEQHDWNGCKCVKCGKKRDNQHNWSKDCEKCSKCGKTTDKQHNWAGCKCSKCGTIRDEQHLWLQDCEKCSECGKTRENHHKWDGCKCSICGQTRDKQHLGELDCTICTKCMKPKHLIEDFKCLNCGKTFDIEGNAYKVDRFFDCLEIFKENLNVSCFKNGDPIPEVKSDDEWERVGEAQKPAWCYYKNDPNNGNIYGKLYNWFAINDSRGLAPKGWHISTHELDVLLSSKYGYDFDTNMSRLSILLAGERRVNGESFVGLGQCASFWTTTSNYNNTMAYFNVIYDRKSELWNGSKEKGLSVRCARNLTSDGGIQLDNCDEKYLKKCIDDCLRWPSREFDEKTWRSFLKNLEENGLSEKELKDKGFIKFNESKLREYIQKRIEHLKLGLT